MTREITISADEFGEMIDEYMIEHHPEVPAGAALTVGIEVTEGLVSITIAYDGEPEI